MSRQRSIYANELDGVADVVYRLYVQRPDLICSILETMGCLSPRILNNSIRSICPLHHGDNHNAFAVWYDLEAPIWKCYSHGCGGGRLATLVMRKFGFDFKQALQWLAEKVGVPIDMEGFACIDPAILQDMRLQQLERRLQTNDVIKPNIFPEDMVVQSMFREPTYFIQRGFNPEVLKYCQVGFVPARTWVWRDPQNLERMVGWFDDRVSIPWRDIEGRLIGFAGRRVDGVKDKKYLFLPGTKRALALYGLHDKHVRKAVHDSGTLHLVEGYPDFFRALEHGLWNFAVVGGTELSMAQRAVMESMLIQEVVLFFDGDEAGRKVSRSIAEQLKKTFRVKIATPPTGTDPGELTIKEEFVAPLSKATFAGSAL